MEECQSSHQIPIGSYRRSCSGFTLSGGTLSASCHNGKPTGRGGAHINTTINYCECLRDGRTLINNNRGNLECVLDMNAQRTQHKQQLINALPSLTEDVGSNMTPEQLEELTRNPFPN